ncbi:hypothetical protein DACRYDRAFT_109967 [Dacryopinax primogenitus]|uniref:Uncharacterized protein n=1 Tax=Dacryopinax primogenitus (strain DJM 731) TaxID=1858805 RepID=M5G098_DACPD|nr:uncharacterized protein DACRYDRAFT_109967 [Dacryopinax primogenitus]EJT99246.1 hypothetical protein DACRYDRAFT_109967 [Dacryopinax primogenitus]
MSVDPSQVPLPSHHVHPPYHTHHAHTHAHPHPTEPTTPTLPLGMRIPDLRFEQGYLKAISKYVPSLLGAEGGTKWVGVGWVTLRDQLLSPFLQGAVLGAAQSLLFPLFPRVRKAIFSNGSPAPADRASGTPWLRKLFGSLLPASA